MKTLLALALVAATTVPAAADDVHAKDADAANLIAALRAGGVKLRKGKGKAAKKSTLVVTQLDCESTTNENLDPSDASADVPEQSCTALAPRKLSLRESGWLIAALGKVGIDLDCAMSHCKLIAQEISCTVDTSVESFSGGGRFQCTIKNGE